MHIIYPNIYIIWNIRIMLCMIISSTLNIFNWIILNIERNFLL